MTYPLTNSLIRLTVYLTCCPWLTSHVCGLQIDVIILISHSPFSCLFLIMLTFFLHYLVLSCIVLSFLVFSCLLYCHCVLNRIESLLLIGQPLNKAEQLSNWDTRPLSSHQVQYVPDPASPQRCQMAHPHLPAMTCENAVPNQQGQSFKGKQGNRQIAHMNLTVNSAMRVPNLALRTWTCGTAAATGARASSILINERWVRSQLQV